MKTQQQKHLTNFIKIICKCKTNEEQKQAELNFLRYIKLAEKINERMHRNR
jgi:hypothetical protein